MFKAKFPDCIKSSSNKSDLYNYCSVHCLGCTEKENIFKVINKIIKLITVEK
jgi:hypothetical protein